MELGASLPLVAGGPAHTAWAYDARCRPKRGGGGEEGDVARWRCDEKRKFVHQSLLLIDRRLAGRISHGMCSALLSYGEHSSFPAGETTRSKEKRGRCWRRGRSNFPHPFSFPPFDKVAEPPAQRRSLYFKSH